jgi:hypothetical protein
MFFYYFVLFTLICERSDFYMLFLCILLTLLILRYEIVNGVVEVDGVSDEPTNENAAEGEDSDGIN